MSLRDALFGRVARSVGAVDGWVQAHSSAHKKRNAWIVETLDVRDGMRVLEIGCGPGLRLEAIARAAPHADLNGFDVSDPLLRSAAKRLAALGAEVRFHVQAGDVDAVATAGRFDRVLAVDAPRAWNVAEVAPLLAKALAVGGQIALCFEEAEGGAELADRLREALSDSGLAAVRLQRLHAPASTTLALLGLKL